MTDSIFIDTGKTLGAIKRINAVNNGPVRARGDQSNGNFDAYKDACIPYARTHDAAFYAAYGGEHTVDIMAIFPNFDADENDPASYDFQLTDEYMEKIMAAGTKVFYRLGHKIEHASKKYGTLPPKDFHKWARICEHIIRHMNEGWADGHEWNIDYWEIWNEPDLDADDSPNKRCWGGTKAQFFDFFEIAAKYLKGCFPNLKIGGPALAGNMVWAEDFLREMHKRGVPLDFFSWHRYSTNPYEYERRALATRKLMDENGYENAESIFNEWNYVRGWSDDFPYTLKAIKTIKGASFTAAAMAVGQKAPIDMMMYYDARPCGFNGLFGLYTLSDKLKCYYTFVAARDLAKAGTELALTSDNPDIYGIAATDGSAISVMLTYYREQDGSPDRDVTLSFEAKKDCVFTAWVTDDTRDREKVLALKLYKGKNDIRLSMKQFDVWQIEIK